MINTLSSLFAFQIELEIKILKYIDFVEVQL